MILPGPEITASPWGLHASATPVRAPWCHDRHDERHRRDHRHRRLRRRPPQHPQRRLRHRHRRRDPATPTTTTAWTRSCATGRATSARSSATTASRTRSSSRRCASGRRRRPTVLDLLDAEHHLLDRLMEECRAAIEAVVTGAAPGRRRRRAAPPRRRDGRPPRPRGPRGRAAVRPVVLRRRVRGHDQGGDEAGRARQAGRVHRALRRVLDARGGAHRAARRRPAAVPDPLPPDPQAPRRARPRRPSAPRRSPV